ncbi:MAG: ABC transporter permease [Pseudomonadota bacterium]
MKLRDFKIGFRLLIQEPGYSAVVILGLSVGFAACILLLSFVRYSFNYNAQVPDAQNVYVLKQRFNLDPRAPWFEIGPLGLFALARQNPAVQGASAISKIDTYTVRIQNQTQQEELLHVSSNFAQMLGIKALAGDVKLALARPDGLALTQDVAQKWFGSASAVGKSVLIDNHLLQVLALIPNPATNTTMPYNALVGEASVLMAEQDRANLSKMDGNWGRILIKLKPGDSPSAMTHFLQDAVDHSILTGRLQPEQRQQLGKRSVMDIRLTPLLDSYFDRDVVGQPFSGPRGNRNSVIGLAAVALLVLALAVINYVNLASVRVLRRQRKIAMRKLLGASVPGVIGQFMLESILVSILATAAGLVLGWLCLPLFAELLERKLDSLFSLANISMSIALGLLVGMLSGIQPAWIALRVSAAKALAGRPNTESARGARLRWSMTVLQFATAVGLAGITMVISYQTYFASNANPGFDTAPLLVVDSHSIAQADGRAFRDALARLPGVSGVAGAGDAIGRHQIAALAGFARPGKPEVSVHFKAVSPEFFKVYNLAAVAGRVFNPQLDDLYANPNAAVIVLNAAAVKDFGFASAQAAIGQMLVATIDRKGTTVQLEIIGVAPDLLHESLHEAPVATAYRLSNNVRVLTLRVERGMQEVERAVETLWQQHFPDEELRMKKASSFFAANYAEDAQLAKLLAAASCIALAIAGFGIYVLSAYSVRRKEREIVLRKLYGALPRDIAQLILRDCLAVIAAGAALGLPFAYLAAQRYLAGFMLQAPLALWATVVAALCAALLVLLASLRQTMLAMQTSPMLAFRDE